jgi:hypothetical protein
MRSKDERSLMFTLDPYGPTTGLRLQISLPPVCACHFSFPFVGRSLYKAYGLIHARGTGQVLLLLGMGLTRKGNGNALSPQKCKPIIELGQDDAQQEMIAEGGNMHLRVCALVLESFYRPSVFFAPILCRLVASRKLPVSKVGRERLVSRCCIDSP